MRLANHMTKIVATIGPASESPEVLRQMLEAGMAVARLNFSHGDFDSHQRVIDHLRQAASAAGRRLAILADLPGPKMRRPSNVWPLEQAFLHPMKFESSTRCWRSSSIPSRVTTTPF